MCRREISTSHADAASADGARRGPVRAARVNCLSALCMTMRGEEGIAIVVAMMTMVLLTALGSALVLTTSSETIIAASFRDGVEALYAADAAVERAIADVSAAGDWTAILSGAAPSSFVDGAPSGTRALADGSTIDLGQLLNLANCSTIATCSTDGMDLVTGARPWGANNPRWQLYAIGSLARVLPGSVNSPFYVVVMVADDGGENDGDPAKDGAMACDGEEPVLRGDPPTPSCNPGSGVIVLRGQAFGPRGARRSVEVTVARAFIAPGGTAPDTATGGDAEGYNDAAVPAGVRMVSWREVR